MSEPSDSFARRFALEQAVAHTAARNSRNANFGSDDTVKAAKTFLTFLKGGGK